MKIKPIALAVYATMGLALSGCIDFGGLSTNNNDTTENTVPTPTTVTLQGTGADGLLQGAKVCLDENRNWQCDAAEPQTTTDNQGKYQLILEKTATEVQNLNVIIEAGATTPGNETGAYLALVRQVDDPAQPQDVTPITTMLAQGVTEEQLKTIMNASNADIDLNSADVVVNNPVVKEYAVSLAKVLASKLQQATGTQAIGDVIKAATQEIATKLKDQTTALSADELSQTLQQVQVEVTSDKLADVLVAIVARDEKDNALSDAQVEVRLVDDQGNVITADNGQTVITAKTDELGRALIRMPTYQTTNLPKDDTGSVYATAQVKILKKGFAPIERIVRNVRLGDSLNVRAALAAMPVKTQKVAATLQFNGAFVASEQPLVFALVSQGGSKQVITGQDAVAQAESNADVVISIPPVWIDTEKTKAVTAAIRGFDSANQQAVQAFPGEFKGIGKPVENEQAGVKLVATEDVAQAQQTEEVVQLVSAAFARIDLTDQNGEPLTFNTQATAQAEEPITVYLKIPASAYDLIQEKGDASSSAPDWQLPVYVFDGYQWKYAGLGTVVTYDATTGGYSAADLTNGLDSGTTYFAEIKVTDATQWLEWINLDWPIELNAPKALTGSVVYEGDTPEPYTGDGWLVTRENGQDVSWDWIWIEEGAIQGVERPDSVLSNAQLVIYNDRFNYVGQRADIQQDGDGYKVSMTLQNPYRCQVQGTVEKENTNGNTPLSGVYVAAGTNDYTYYQYAYTDPTGTVSLAVPCNQDIAVYVNDKQLSLNVNGEQGGDEVEDKNGIARFNVTQVNTKPYLWASTDTPKLTIFAAEQQSFTIYADAYDVDDDSVSIQIACPTGTTPLASAAEAVAYRALTCNIDSNIFAEGEAQKVLTATVTATDASNNISEEKVDIVVERALDNNPPIVLGLDRDGVFIPCDFDPEGFYRCVDTVRADVGSVSYDVIAYDPDGDLLTFQGNSNISVPQTGETVQKISVQDQPGEGVDPTTSQVQLLLTAAGNLPPDILAVVDIVNARINEPVTLHILVDDDAPLPENENPVIKINGTEQNIALTPDPESGGYWTAAMPTDTAGTYQVEVVYTDADGVTSTYTLTYTVESNAPPSVWIDDALFANDNGTLALYILLSVLDDAELDGTTAEVKVISAQGDTVATETLSVVNVFNEVSVQMPTSLEAGTYTVEVTVTDKDGSSATETREVTYSPDTVIDNTGSVNDGGTGTGEVPLNLTIQ